MNQTDVEFEAKPLVEFYRRLLRCLDITLIDMVFFSGIMGKDDLQRKPEYLAQAYEIGARLVQYAEI